VHIYYQIEFQLLVQILLRKALQPPLTRSTLSQFGEGFLIHTKSRVICKAAKHFKTSWELGILVGDRLFGPIVDQDNSSGDQHQCTQNGKTDRFIKDEPTEDHAECRGQKAKGGHV